jgi:hypothetical protein
MYATFLTNKQNTAPIKHLSATTVQTEFYWSFNTELLNHAIQYMPTQQCCNLLHKNISLFRNVVFSVMTQCRLVDGYQSFRGMYYLHLHLYYEDGGDNFPQKAGNLLQEYMVV